MGTLHCLRFSTPSWKRLVRCSVCERKILAPLIESIWKILIPLENGWRSVPENPWGKPHLSMPALPSDARRHFPGEQTLLGATDFSSGCLPMYPRGSLHKTKLPASCLGADKNVPASEGSPPCQVGVWRLRSQALQAESLLHSALLTEHGPNRPLGASVASGCGSRSGIGVLGRAGELFLPDMFLLSGQMLSFVIFKYWQYWTVYKKSGHNACELKNEVENSTASNAHM